MILLLTHKSTLRLFSGDQVSSDGGMTGGFFDYRRSRLKYIKIIRDNETTIQEKTAHLDNVGKELQDILI